MHTARARIPKPVLFDELSAILPTTEQTWFLRACLHSGQAGRKAWQAWQEHVGNAKRAIAEDRQGVKRLLPLLYSVLQGNGGAVDGEFVPYLRAAYFYEELRSDNFRRLCRYALSALEGEGVPIVVLKGAALAETVYCSWVLRHCHDIDILIRQDGLPRATTILQAAGFSRMEERIDGGDRDIQVKNASGLTVSLHCDLFQFPYYQVSPEEIWRRSIRREVLGVPSRVLAPADSLFHVCGHAWCSKRSRSVPWVCDAWHIVKHDPNLDWDLLLTGIVRTHLALPLSVMFNYLAGELGCPIPDAFLRKLGQAERRSSRLSYEAALEVAGTGIHGGARQLLSRNKGWGERALLLKWMLFPSPARIRQHHSVRHSWLLPLYYVYRPLRYVLRRH